MAAELPRTREELRVRIAQLQTRLQAALAEKQSRIQAIVALCRAERAALRDELQQRRKQALAQVELDVRAARAGAKLVRLSRLAEARKGADSGVAAARAAVAVERQHQDELRRIAADVRRRRAEVHRQREVSLQGVVLHSALLGSLAPLLQRVANKVRPVPGESPAAALLRYAQTHPAEAHAAAEPRAETEIARTREELARAKASLRISPRAPTTKVKEPLKAVQPPRLAPVRAPAVPTPAGAKLSLRRPGQLPRGGGGMLIAELLRERDALAKRSSAEPKARPVAFPGSKPRRTRTTKSPGSEKPRSPPAAKYSPAAATKNTWSASAAPAGAIPAPPRTEKTVKAPDAHDTAKIAAMIREDIKAAVGARELPRAKYSVATSKYSMGSSIDVVVSALPFPVFNDNAFVLEGSTARFDSARFRSRFTPDAEAVERKLEEIVSAYHWDRSDPQSDYYNARFHKDIRLDSRGEMDRITRVLRAGASGGNAKTGAASPMPVTPRKAAPSASIVASSTSGAKVIPFRPRSKQKDHA